MSPLVLYSALLLGFAGSLHCVGMCGPLALGFAGQRITTARKMLHYFLYFSGKTSTYAFMGLLFGFFGQGLVLAGLQQILSVGMGVVMLLIVVIGVLKASWLHHNQFTIALQNKLIPLFGSIIHRPGVVSSFFLGLLNGLLPCGLVYMGLTAAVATGNSLQAATYMLLFGLGTIPVMLAFLVFTMQLSYGWRSKLRQLTPVVLTIMGTILILRGLNLGIPYLSPLMDSLSVDAANVSGAAGCHP